ncbi:4-hydroxybenzoate 3-monooxygenase OS=Streptomyces tendae OX=1932 GN=GUR47_27950 PE=4 SV=1 [Streptomyces tendae]
MRSPSVSRPSTSRSPPTRTPDGWSNKEIWDKLERRFETDDDWSLRRGPITQKSVTPMRSYVHEPMRHGRLFLAGDAAHIVPPTGAKGLNLAVGDVVTFAPALSATAPPAGSDELLDAYSATCLRRVWQAVLVRHDDAAARRPRRHALRPAPAGPPRPDRLLPRRDRPGPRAAPGSRSGERRPAGRATGREGNR